MKTRLRKRVESFLIRTGIIAISALAVYLSNLGDIREIDTWKLVTIAVTVVAANIVSEITKYGYNLRVESQELEDLSNY